MASAYPAGFAERLCSEKSTEASVEWVSIAWNHSFWFGSFIFRLSAVSLQRLEACVPDSWAALRVCCAAARIAR